jgi:hypothetical protein
LHAWVAVHEAHAPPPSVDGASDVDPSAGASDDESAVPPSSPGPPVSTLASAPPPLPPLPLSLPPPPQPTPKRMLAIAHARMVRMGSSYAFRYSTSVCVSV